MARNQGVTERTKRDEERDRGDTSERGWREGTSLAGRPPRGEVVRSTPFSLFERMFGDMDRIIEDFGLGRALGGFERGLGEWNPQVEVLERNGKLIVRADLPGVKQEDLHVRLEDELLVLSGERRSDRTEEREGFWRSERSYGRFERAVALPPGVDPSACDARFEDGVLEIQLTLPKQARAGREIPIGAGASGKTLEGKTGEKAEKTTEKEQGKRDLS